ncbi:histone protein [Streptomyces sp. NPDC014724]|uniref:histone protein n=1 Tax=unclassified Streptomyces TaxID=2593676 RepID=UPI0036FB0B48
MDDTAKVTLAAAVVGGYVLGRTKKGRLALTIATYLAGRRFGLEPRQLAAEGMRRLGEIPQVADLQEQLKGEVLDAGRKAVSAAADRGMSSLADALGDRTARLGEKKQDAEEEEEDADEYEPEEEGAEYAEEEEEEPEEEYEEEEEPEASAQPRREPRGGAARKKADSAQGGKSRTAKKTGARKAAPAKKNAARKTTSSKRAASKRVDRRR